MRQWLKRNWFLVGLVVVLVASWLAPAEARSAAGGWVGSAINTACIVGIFLISGLTLPTRQLGQGVAHWRLHLFVQSISFIITPALFVALDQGLGVLSVHPGLRQGLLVLACLPTTVTSCVVLTRVARGNEAGALFNAVVGNLLGVMVTPLLVVLVIGRSGHLEVGRAISQLAMMVVLPVLVGQAVQLWRPAAVGRWRGRLAPVGPALLLVVMVLIFTRSFGATLDVPLRDVLVVAAIVVATHSALLVMTWKVGSARALRLNTADRMAAALCASQKTIALGIPLITVLFGRDPWLALISLPLVVYHPVQLVIDGFLAPVWGQRQATAERAESHA